MGVPTKTISIQDGAVGTHPLLHDEFSAGTRCLAMNADTLAVMNKASTSSADLQRFIAGYSTELLVFGCTSSTEQRSAVTRLTRGTISGIRPLGNGTAYFALTRNSIEFNRQLAGLTFPKVSEELIFTFELGNPTPDVEVIMTANERPIFVRMHHRSCQIFLLAGLLPDIDKPLSRDHGLEDHYDSLIPALIFLRHTFREICWHAPQTTARLIIDDPLLSKRYGFLDYSILLESMQRRQYGTSIAFIPWNYWRTSRQNTSRLLGEGSNLSICIHGCDHTNREFETHATALLDRKAGLAQRRMESQRKRTDAAFENVMVFPQGLFSKAALPALRANNYLAAVNTTCFPTDSGPDDLKLGDFLRPAITRYNGFPIFQRRYPRRLFDFAFDLFLGKPALVVEHHEYFRDGCEALEKFVEGLYHIEPALSWPTLTAQLTRSCLQRTLSDGSTEVQFFTKKFQLAGDGWGSGRLLLSKHEPDSALIQAVLVDGTSVPYSIKNGFLKLELQADPTQVRNIEIVDQSQPRWQDSEFGITHNAGVLLRRGLSEFRDTTLARHAGLLSIAQRIAKALKVTGDA
jgi:hypothetical protein